MISGRRKQQEAMMMIREEYIWRDVYEDGKSWVGGRREERKWWWCLFTVVVVMMNNTQK